MGGGQQYTDASAQRRLGYDPPMPEGDTIFRTADVLRRALAGELIVAAQARHGPRYGTPPELSRIVGATVDGVEPRGKHLLMHFSTGLTLHSHLGMHGTWHCYPGDAVPERVERAAARLATHRYVAALFGPTVLELVETRALERTPFLASLGPDLLRDDFDATEALRRLRLRPDMPIAEALLDQRALAGLGNVYKSELLFLARVHPARPVAQLEDATLTELIANGAKLLRENVRGGARVTTRGAREAAGAPLWVYGRARRPCRRCGTPVRYARDGRAPRSTFWCPRCQPEVPA